jgi:polyhydroxyalkanoate synthesis regulator phasin
MKDLFKKGILTGIGIGLMTKEKVQDFAKKAAEEAKLTKEEGRKFTDELLKQSEETKQQIEEKINHQVKMVIDKLGVATQEDLGKIQKRLDELQSFLSNKISKKNDS